MAVAKEVGSVKTTEGLSPTMVNALRKVGDYYADAVREKLISEGLHSSGELGASIDYKIINGNLEFEQTKYGGAIDEGSNPASQGHSKISKAFLNNIMSWANMKGITPDKGGDSRGAMKSMAWAIAKTIKKDGLVQRYGNQGAKIYDKVYAELEDRIGADIMEAYKTDIENQLKRM